MVICGLLYVYYNLLFNYQVHYSHFEIFQMCHWLLLSSPPGTHNSQVLKKFKRMRPVKGSQKLCLAKSQLPSKKVLCSAVFEQLPVFDASYI